MLRTLAVAVATFVLLSGQAQAVYTGPQRVVQGCTGSWVSNGIWAIRVAKIRRAADRFDVWSDWRNDSKVSQSPMKMPHEVPFTAVDLAFPGDRSIGLNDTVVQHPEREKPPAVLTRRYAPGETYRSLLHFYWEGASPKAAPTAFQAGPLITWRVPLIRVRLTC